MAQPLKSSRPALLITTIALVLRTLIDTPPHPQSIDRISHPENLTLLRGIATRLAVPSMPPTILLRIPLHFNKPWFEKYVCNLVQLLDQLEFGTPSDPVLRQNAYLGTDEKNTEIRPRCLGHRREFGSRSRGYRAAGAGVLWGRTAIFGIKERDPVACLGGKGQHTPARCIRVRTISHLPLRGVAI